MQVRILLVPGFLMLMLLWKGSATYGQNVAVNTTGAVGASTNMFEVTQASAANNTVGIFSKHTGVGTNAYAIWAEATGATNKYAMVVPSGGGYVGIGNITPATFLELQGNNVNYIGQLRLSATDYTQISFYNSGALTANAANRLGDIYYDIANATLNIENNSSNKFLLLNPSGGKVGIGTSAPIAKFHVEGATVFFRNSAVNSSGVDIYGGTDGTNSSTIYMKNPAGNISTFLSDGTYNSFLNYLGGNVGIAHNNPIEKLHVNGNIAIGVNTPNSPTVLTYRFYAPDNAFSSNQVSGGNSVEIGAGNMTTTTLPIVNTVTAGSLVLKGGSVGDLGNNGTGPCTFNAGNIDLYGGYSISGVLAGSVTRNAGNIRFFTSTNATNDDVTFTERMRVSANGNVGIGTTSPNTRLQVVGGVSMPLTVTATSLTLNNSHYNVVVTAAAQTITLPAAAAGNTGWIYTIAPSFGAGFVNISNYTNLSGVTVNTIAAGTSITVQSDGTNWYQIR